MAKKEDIKLGTSNLEEIYFLKENERLIQKIREKNHRKNGNNVTPLFSSENNNLNKSKKAA